MPGIHLDLFNSGSQNGDSNFHNMLNFMYFYNILFLNSQIKVLIIISSIQFNEVFHTYIIKLLIKFDNKKKMS